MNNFLAAMAIIFICFGLGLFVLAFSRRNADEKIACIFISCTLLVLSVIMILVAFDKNVTVDIDVVMKIIGLTIFGAESIIVSLQLVLNNEEFYNNFDNLTAVILVVILVISMILMSGKFTEIGD